MSLEKLFLEELISMDQTFSTQQELFEYAFQVLIEKKLVGERFLNKIIEREKIYPTGLDTKVYDVAIPHTDPAYVTESFIFPIKINETIAFSKMGSRPEEKELVYPKFVFLIGFTKGELQLEILQGLVKMFSDEESMTSLVQAKNSRELYQVLCKKIGGN